MTELEKTLQQLRRLRAPGCPPLRALGEFLDGQASREQMQTVQAHLQGCPACTNSLIDLRELARLEKHGERPPADLIRELKGLVQPEETATAPSFSVRERVHRAWSAILTVLRDRAVARFGVELAGAMAVAVLALYVTGIIPSQRVPEGAPKPLDQLAAVTDLTGAGKRVVEAVSLALPDPLWIQKKVLPALEKLPETLVLEETRGATNIEVYKKAAPATVLVVTDKSLGSGVVVSGTGDIVTNWHVVRDAKELGVIFKPQRGVDIQQERVFAATLVKVDEVADLALLRVARKDLQYLRLGDVAKIEVGQDAHSIGHPEGEIWTYTAGVVSQVRPDYQWKGEDGVVHRGTVVQTQTAINPGNSGGPLLNDRAEVIGINSFRGEGEGLNYAVAADVVGGFLRGAEGLYAPRAAPRGKSSGHSPEVYGNIKGAYISTSAPPPDVWFVYRDPREAAAYSALGSVEKTQINTVIKGEDSGWTTMLYYFDTNCDGIIDLIGRAAQGSDKIESYQLPQGSLRLSTVAGELATALRQHKIPYPQVRFCE